MTQFVICVVGLIAGGLYGLKRAWRDFKCEADMHDERDSDSLKEPVHFYRYRCKHCGRRYFI